MNHTMRLSEIDFGDDIKLLICDQCGRSVSYDTDDNGRFIVKVVNQGDFNASHQFAQDGVSIDVAYEDQ